MGKIGKKLWSKKKFKKKDGNLFVISNKAVILHPVNKKQLPL